MDIRPAATLVLTRDTDNGIEALLLQRSWEAIFMPGYFVFPGGAVNEQEPEARAHLIGIEDAAISQTMSLDEGGADYMLAAVRECFEEAGVLLAQDGSGKLVDSGHAVHGERFALFREEVSLAQLCEKHQLTLPLDRLAYLSHWVTPPGPPRRFDTRFLWRWRRRVRLPVMMAPRPLNICGFRRRRRWRSIGAGSGCWGCRRFGRCGC